jgi:hypothetical protein
LAASFIGYIIAHLAAPRWPDPNCSNGDGKQF